MCIRDSNYDDLCRGLNDNARSALRSAIDQEIENWTKPTHGLVIRYDRDRYLFIFEERYLTGLQEGKFALLDAVRKVQSTNGLPASMSIGIGTVSYTHLDVYKRQAASSLTSVSNTT